MKLPAKPTVDGPQHRGRRARPATPPKSSGPSAPPSASSGLAARDAAVSALFTVFAEHRSFDEALTRASEQRTLAPRDRAFARLIATTVLRQRGALAAVLNSFLERPLPEKRGRLEAILLAAAAQLLMLETPAHAAISLAVDQCRADREASRFANLANAVLRKVSQQGAARLKPLDNAQLTVPAWLQERWRAAYGAADAAEIARASLREPPLDVTVKQDASDWAQRLGGRVLPTGSVRLAGGGRIEDLPGFEAGAWWVQDAAAALPARLLGEIAGLEVADLCAAPGGKTAQLAAAGAKVTAVDKSPGRLRRVTENLARLGLEAETIAADAAQFAPGRMFDAVLIDAPCTATGTIRRHPDILYLKRPEDVAALAAVQARILEAAAQCVRPGGRLVYCTCSLEPEECQQQIASFLARNAGFARDPVRADEIGGEARLLTAEGDLRTLPFHWPGDGATVGGLDGFFAARLKRLT